MHNIQDINNTFGESFYFQQNPGLLDKLLKGVLKGFETHYKLDTEDETILNEEMKRIS